jgi:hypothetical protein
MYKIKWEGYSKNEATWEPLKNLDKITDMIEDFDLNFKKIRKRINIGNLSKPSSKLYKLISSYLIDIYNHPKKAFQSLTNDGPYDLYVCESDSCFRVTDGVIHIQCDFVFNALVLFKRGHPWVSIKSLKDKTITIQRFSFILSINSKEEMPLSILIYEFSANASKSTQKHFYSTIPVDYCDLYLTYVKAIRPKLLKSLYKQKLKRVGIPLIEFGETPSKNVYVIPIEIDTKDDSKKFLKNHLGNQLKKSTTEQIRGRVEYRDEKLDYTKIDVIEIDAAFQARQLLLQEEREKAAQLLEKGKRGDNFQKIYNNRKTAYVLIEQLKRKRPEKKIDIEEVEKIIPVEKPRDRSKSRRRQEKRSRSGSENIELTDAMLERFNYWAVQHIPTVKIDTDIKEEMENCKINAITVEITPIAPRSEMAFGTWISAVRNTGSTTGSGIQ